MATKTPWTFERNIQTADARQARALEHIAQYLDLIEGHLSVLAAAAKENREKDGA